MKGGDRVRIPIISDIKYLRQRIRKLEVDLFLGNSVCAKCGHLILSGHVDNKRIDIIDRSSGTEITYGEVYSKSCKPAYDIIEIGLDNKTRYFKRDNEKVIEVFDDN